MIALGTNPTSSSQKNGGFWNELFPARASRRVILQQLSGEINAKFTAGGFWLEDKVQLAYKTWTITLDMYESTSGRTNLTSTSLRVPYITVDGCRFNIYRAGFFSRLGVRLGMQDMKIGEEEFDNEFIIQGNNEAKLREFLSSKRLRERISSQPDMAFYVRDSEGMFGPLLPPSACELNIRVPYIIRDLARLKMLFELTKVALDQLQKIGSASIKISKVRL